MTADRELREASRTTWDVIVVGAGPAGAMAAHQIARQGASVLLVDRAEFPRPKVCGCCLNLRALAALQAAELGQLPATLGARPLRKLTLAAHGHQACMPLPGGVALSRSALDAALVSAAQSGGAHFLPRTIASLGEVDAAGRCVRLTRGAHSVEARGTVVLAADGLAGSLTQRESPGRVHPASRIGAGAIAEVPGDRYQDGTIFMACARHGYVGLVRLEDGRLNLAAALDAAFVRDVGGLAPAARTILHDAGLSDLHHLELLSWHGTPTLTRRPSRVAGWRLLVLGDAAGYVEPFTGEGIAWALDCGMAIAPLVARALEAWSPALEIAWTLCHRDLIARRQGACRAIALALRHPSLVRGVVRLLAHAPQLARPMVAHFNSDRSRPRCFGGHGAALP